MNTQILLDLISSTAEDLKAIDPVIFDLEGKSSVSDFIFICHGTSTAHTRGISDKISLTLKKENKLPLGIEGYEEGQWILIDYNTVIVHIFLKHVREQYSLEEIYNTSPKKES